MWIKKDEIRAAGVDVDALPVVDIVGSPRCSVQGCGARGAENHHWAPREAFGADADLWPTDYLCVPHHDRWHETMTTAVTTAVNHNPRSKS